MIAARRPSWQIKLAKAYRNPAALLRDLELPVDAGLVEDHAHSRFSLRVPRSFVARMRKGDPHDPLLRQVLPSRAERINSIDYGEDPVGDRDALRQPGLLEKYRGRVLLLTTNACAINCRYCFRKHLRCNTRAPQDHHLGRAIAYIKSHPTIREIILSGGDPLCLTDAKLAGLTTRLEEIAHIKRLRVHTRLPVVLPERVSDGLLRWFSRQPWQMVLVLHVNHANEIDAQVVAALARLRAAGVTLLNQSVLLKEVNDSLSALAELSEALFAAGVLPYYLHLLDRVQGASHFEVPVPQARLLMDGLRRELPGYLVPRLVQEAAGLPYKLPI
ncbi:MAG: EF-P beta-lysylation protein EpmB [Gammaproteobacteria bacterium]|jgi:EF-P beta-lysylation protein EpmB